MVLEHSWQGIFIAEGCGWKLFTVCEVCAPFLWINVQFLYVFFSCVLQYLCFNFTWSRIYRNLSLLPLAHICAKRHLPWEGMSVCMLVLFKTISICLFQSCNPRSHLDNVSIHTHVCLCVCTCMIEVERGQASGRTTCGRLDRHVLCI